MSMTQSITEYMNSAEKIINLQKQTIEKLKETIAAKNTLHDSLIDYVKKIYDVLETGSDKAKEDAMWHLRNLCYPND